MREIRCLRSRSNRGPSAAAEDGFVADFHHARVADTMAQAESREDCDVASG